MSQPHNVRTGSGGSPPPSEALQACLHVAMGESKGLITRWITGLMNVLRQEESWAVGPALRADLSRALQQLAQFKQPFIDRWVENWGNAVNEALRHPGQVGPPKRSLASINFDDLELMDDVQIQATVQVARLEQAVQGAAGDALAELNALVSRAQGFVSTKPEYNPLRPDVAVTALRLTMEGITRDKAVRTLWLQHGTDRLGQELQVLYRHLVQLLTQHGITPADYQVIQAPTAPTVPRGGGAGRQRPPGLADQYHDTSHTGADATDDVVPSELLTLDYLHDLLVSSPADLSHANLPPLQPVPMIDVPGTRLPGAAPAGASTRWGAVQPSAAERKGGPPAQAPLPADAVNPLQALASEVVSLMLHGITRDARLLPPVRDMLHKLEPALLRIAHDDPRFFVDKQNPARRLLDEITQRSLAFSAETAPGFAAFQATLEDLIPLLERTDVRLTSLFETALDVLAPAHPADHARQAQDTARVRAVASLVQAEQRFLVADRVAKELSERRDFAMAHRAVRKFLLGPWAQVIAQARLVPTLNETLPKARMPADMRYLGVVSDLIWSSRVDAASRNRSRLARVIPGLLRTLREGLQTIDYEGAHARHFLGTLMGLHATAMKLDPVGTVVTGNNVQKAVSPQSGQAISATDSESDDDDPHLWISPTEAADSGFMDGDFPTTRPTITPRDAAAQPGVDAWDDTDDDSLVRPVPALAVGAWIELCRESGEWVRLQLAWRSPHGLMYLFGSHGGRTSSMSRRAFEDMCRAARIRLVAGHSVVDDALGRVLDVATRNSARTPAPSGHDTVYPDLLPPLS